MLHAPSAIQKLSRLDLLPPPPTPKTVTQCGIATKVSHSNLSFQLIQMLTHVAAAPTPTPKSFTDEELKQHFGISMATRLEADEPDKQFKWADLDDEGGWQPSPPQWMDGSKSSMPTTEKPQEPPATEQSQKPTPNLESSNEESAGPKAILKPTSKPAATTKPGLVLKSVPEGPPTPTKNTDSSSSKSPWASLPAVDKASPIAFVSPADRKDAPATGASKDLSTGESKIDTNAPPRVINADSFSRDYDGSYAVTSKSRYDFKTNTWKLVDAPTASDPESGASKIMHPTTLLRRPSQSVAQQEDVTQNITPAGADDIDKMHRSGMSESVAKAQAKKQQLAAEEQRAEEAKRQRLQAKIAALGPEADTANTATVKPDSSGNENPQSSLAEQRHQTITQPWNSSTASGNHPSQGWSASTGSSGNVWGPPGNDKTLGNGVFASDLNQYRPSELQSPGPIAPPSAAPLPAPKAPEARVDLDSNTKPQRVAPMNTASNVRSSARGPAKAVTRPADTAAATRSGIAAALQAMGSTMGAAAPKQAGWSNFAAGIKSSDRILDAEATTRGRQPRPEATSVALKETFHQTTEDGKVAGVTQHKFDLKKQQEAKDESSKAIDAKQPSSVKADAPKPTVDSAGTQHTRRPVDNAKVAASKPIQQSLEQTAKPVAQTEATQTQVAPPQAVGTSKPTPKTPSVSSEAVAQSEPAKVLPAVDASSVLGSKAGLDRIDEPMMHTAHPTSVELGSNPAKSPLPFSHSLGARTSRFFGVGGGLNAQTPISKPPNHPHTPLQPPPSTDHYLHAVDPSSQPIVNLPKARPVVNIPKTLDVEPVADTATEPVVMTPRPQLHAGQKPIVTQAEWQSRFNNLFNRAFGTQDADVTEGTTGTNEEPSGVSPLSKSPFCPHEAAELAAVLIPILQKYYVAPKHEYMLPIHEAATKDSERVLFNGHAHKSEPDITFPEETDVKTPGQDDQLALNAPFSEELSSDFGSTVDILEFPKEDPMQVKLLPKVDLKSDTAASAVHAAPTNAAGNKPVAKLPNWAIPKDTSKPPTMPQYDGTGEGLGKWAEWGRYGIPKGPDGKPLPRPGATKKAQSQPSHPSNAPKQQQPAAKPQADDPNPKFGMGRYDALADGQMA